MTRGAWIEDVIEDVEVGLRRSPGHPVLLLPPDPATTVVWRLTAAGECGVVVAGPRTKASYQASKDLPGCVRMRIRPGLVMPLLGVAADELVDRIVPLAELWGSAAGSLEADLTGYQDDPNRIVDLLASRLAGRAPTRGAARFGMVVQAARGLSAGAGVRETADEVGVSERYLRRIFAEAVGISPKHFARIARVRTLLAKPSPRKACPQQPCARRPWSALAAEVGYFDQSHLVAEFRSIMRVTPGAFEAGRVPITTC